MPRKLKLPDIQGNKLQSMVDENKNITTKGFLKLYTEMKTMNISGTLWENFFEQAKAKINSLSQEIDRLLEQTNTSKYDLQIFYQHLSDMLPIFENNPEFLSKIENLKARIKLKNNHPEINVSATLVAEALKLPDHPLAILTKAPEMSSLPEEKKKILTNAGIANINQFLLQISNYKLALQYIKDCIDQNNPEKKFFTKTDVANTDTPIDLSTAVRYVNMYMPIMKSIETICTAPQVTSELPSIHDSTKRKRL